MIYDRVDPCRSVRWTVTGISMVPVMVSATMGDLP